LSAIAFDQTVFNAVFSHAPNLYIDILLYHYIIHNSIGV